MTKIQNQANEAMNISPHPVYIRIIHVLTVLYVYNSLSAISIRALLQTSGFKNWSNLVSGHLLRVALFWASHPNGYADLSFFHGFRKWIQSQIYI